MLRQILAPLAVVAVTAALGAAYSRAHRFGGEDFEGAALMLLASSIVIGCTLRAVVVSLRAERLKRRGTIHITGPMRAAMVATYLLSTAVVIVIALTLGLGRWLQ